MTMVGGGHRTEKRGDVADVTGTPWLESAKGYFLCLWLNALEERSLF
ncbi:hypothetical protein ACTXK7_12490 [Vreelandella alkaliphila]